MVVFDKDLKMLPLLEHSSSIACSAYIWHRANIFEHLPRGNELRISIVIFFPFLFCLMRSGSALNMSSDLNDG